MQLNQVRLPRENLLGQEGDQIWYTFEVVAPYFLIAMAGAYLGLAQAALNATIEHVKARRYSHSGERLADIHTLQYRLAEMNIAVHKSRGLLYQAAYQGDVGDPQATNMILMAKADAADLAAPARVTPLTPSTQPFQGRRAPRQVPQEREHRRLARADAELSIGFLLISGDLREAEIRPEAAR